MRDFFSRELAGDGGLKLFGALHTAISAAFLILCALVIVFRRNLRGWGHFTAIRCGMAAVLLLNMLIHYSARIILGEWDFSEDLPLHLCFVANFFMIYILFTDNKNRLFRVIYYFTLIGPLPAIIFPDLRRGAGSWMFWQFIVSHHIMLLFSVYCLFVFKYETNLKSAVWALIFGDAYVALIAVFNCVFGTNYVMLGELPAQLYEVFPFLRTLPAAVWLQLAGIAAIAVAFVPAEFVEREAKLS